MSNSFLTAISNLFLSKEQKRAKLYGQLSAYVQFVAGCSEKVLDSPTTRWPMTNRQFANALTEVASYYDKTNLPRTPGKQLEIFIGHERFSEKKVRFLTAKLILGQIF